MSKIAEKKALEIYPDIEINWTMTDRTKERMIYADGYDQAMKDFMEKAEKWLEPIFKHMAGYNCGGDLMNDFENYMKEEL